MAEIDQELVGQVRQVGGQRQQLALAVGEVGEHFLGQVVDEHGAGGEDALEQLVVMDRSAPAHAPPRPAGRPAASRR